MPITINGSGTISGLSVGGLPDGTVQPADLSTGAPVWDTSGNVGIGTASPSVKLDVSQGTADTNSFKVSNEEVAFFGGAYGTGSSYDRQFVLNASRADSGSFPALRLAGQGGIYFAVDANTERARIDSSGNLLVGTTSTNPNPGIAFLPSGAISTGNSNGATGFVYQYFQRNGGTIGSITQNGTTAVAYNTSSDYRLKTDVAPMTGALAKVAALKPCTYKWRTDNSDGEGFIAHELAEVVPQCVTGEKDATDADGNPVYQGIDTSFLVATLTAAIQELNAKVDAQSAEIAALKGQA